MGRELQISMAAARVNANMTQADIASKMKVSKQTIVNWENGHVSPPFAQFKLFCELVGIPEDNIFLPETSTNSLEEKEMEVREMKKERINVMVFTPKTEGGLAGCELKEIDNTLEAMQEIVGGYIEVIPLDGGNDLVLVCNEEGKLKGLPTSIRIWDDPIAGTCFICKTDGEEFASLTD